MSKIVFEDTKWWEREGPDLESKLVYTIAEWVSEKVLDVFPAQVTTEKFKQWLCDHIDEYERQLLLEYQVSYKKEKSK